MNAIGSVTTRHSSNDFADAALDALLELEAAARVLDLEDWIIERLRHPESEQTHTLLVRKDNGQAITVPVVHVQHSTAAGTPSGKLSLAPATFPAQLRSDAMQASWQHALLGLPFGGSATALLCDPRNLSERELQRVAAEFSKLQYIRHHVAYRGPGLNECIAGWMQPATGCTVCGGPEAAGGVPQDSVAAFAICEIIRHWCSRHGRKLAGLRVALQGFEGVGSELSGMLYHAGAQVVAIADVSGGLLDPLGLNVDAVRVHAGREGVLLEYPDAEAVSNTDVLRSLCDVLVLADGTAQVNDALAEHIHAQLVIEFTPSALTPVAERTLTARDIEVVPSILAASGCALAAFIEFSQRDSIRQSPSRVNAFVRRIVRHTTDEVARSAAQWSVGVRHAATAIGVQKVAAGIRAKGF